MKIIFRIFAAICLLTVLPIAATAQDLTPAETAELEKVRLTEDMLSRVKLFAAAAKSGEITMDTAGPAPTGLTEMADRMAASPSVNAYLTRIGLTPRELMMIMMAIFQAVEDAAQPAPDAAIDTLSPRQANVLFYQTHKADIDALIGNAAN